MDTVAVMSHRSVALKGAGILAAILVLAGCAAPAPVHTHTAGPTKPTPTPTPTPTQAAVPSVRVPLKCSELLSDTTAASFLGKPVAYRSDESTLPKDMESILDRQFGSLDCTWAGPDRPDGGYAQYFGVTIAPDAAAGFNTSIGDIEREQMPTLKNFAGDQSEGGCSSDPSDGLFCEANMLAGSYWVYLNWYTGTSRPVATANSELTASLTKIAGLLASTTPAPAWNPPGPDIPAFCSDGQQKASAAAVNAAVGRADIGYDPGETDPGSAASYPEYVGNSYSECFWDTAVSGGASGDFNSMKISMLKGGAWVVPLILKDTGVDSLGLGPFTTLDVPGVGTAAYQCIGETDSCTVLAADGSILIDVDLGDASADKFDAAVINLVTAVARS